MSDDAKNYDEALTVLIGLMKVKASVPEMKAIVQDLIDDAVSAEREECAKIAERDFAQPGEPEMDLPVDVARITIAAAIRARGQTT